MDKLKRACELLLDECEVFPGVYYFQADSEVHVTLVEAITDADERERADQDRHRLCRRSPDKSCTRSTSGSLNV